MVTCSTKPAKISISRRWNGFSLSGMESHDAIEAGLDLPFSCKAGVCCTCRAKVLCGEVVMDKNYTLEGDEMAQGYVLSCQARATTKQLTVSFDER